VGLLALVGLTLASCGLPTDDTYRPIDPNALGALAETTTTSTTTTSTLPPATTTTIEPTTTTLPTTEPVPIFFVDGNQQLTPVTRDVTIPATPEKARALLQAGVLPSDPAGLRSSIPPETLLGVTVSGGKATVTLAPVAQETLGQEQVLLFAQIVMTLTNQRGVGQVEFLLPSVEGAPPAPILVPTPTSPPKTLVSADDYRSLLAPEDDD
jgi:hypothetical protein